MYHETRRVALSLPEVEDSSEFGSGQSLTCSGRQKVAGNSTRHAVACIMAHELRKTRMIIVICAFNILD
jgi:hypothetical protein